MAISFVSRQGGTPIDLTGPQRFTTAAPVVHTAGNLLVAMITHANTTRVVLSVQNTAGDTWIKSTLSPYGGVGTGTAVRRMYIYYAFPTLGNAADVVTVILSPGSDTDQGITVFEFGPASPIIPFQYIGDVANFGTGQTAGNLIFTANLPITGPSAVAAMYLNSNALQPTSPSGVQNQMPTDGPDNNNVHWDSYQLTAAVGRVQATVPGGANPSWGVLAAVFLGGGGVVAGPPCSQIT